MRIEFLDCPIDILSMEETVDLVTNTVKASGFMQHCVINVAKLVNMKLDPTLEASIRQCDLINVDGMGVVLGARLAGIQVPERVAGIDLFYRLLEVSAERGFSVYLLGAEQSVLERVCTRLRERFPDLVIAGYHHGYFWDHEEDVVNDIRNSGSQLLFVAISSPMKEEFIERWKHQFGVNFAMGVGGTFDVLAGKVKRAPLWMQVMALEWVFRLVQEPRRMWKRYLITNTKYLWIIVKELVFRSR